MTGDPPSPVLVVPAALAARAATRWPRAAMAVQVVKGAAHREERVVKEEMEATPIALLLDGPESAAMVERAATADRRRAAMAVRAAPEAWAARVASEVPGGRSHLQSPVRQVRVALPVILRVSVGTAAMAEPPRRGLPGLRAPRAGSARARPPSQEEG